MRKLLPLLAFVLFTLFSDSVFALQTSYLGNAQIDLTILLGPPPVAGSDADKTDLRTVLEAQQTRTSEQIKRAQADVETSVFRFADVVGPDFTAAKLPFTALFFKKVSNDSRVAILAIKDAWQRPRPFLASSEVHPIIDKPTSGSYPSGHSAYAYMTAIILAQLLPEKREAIFARAAEFAHNRIIDGVHYPSDVEGGRIAGTVIAANMLQSPEFKADFAKAKAELNQLAK